MVSTTERYANHEAERALLGIIILRSAECEGLFDKLHARDFDDQKNREVFRAMLDMRLKGKMIDLVTLDEAHPELDPIYLIDLTQKALVTTAEIPAYVDILKTHTARRYFDKLGRNICSDCAGADFSPVKMAENIRACLKGIAFSDGEETGIQDDVLALYDSLFERPEESKGIMLGLPALDAATNGLKRGRLYVVGARPSVGKTVFGLNAALKCALQKLPVLYVNREMEKVDLLKRMAANLSGIDLSLMESGSIAPEDWEKVTDMMAEMNTLPIHITNTARTPAAIRAKAVEIQEQHGLGLVVVDYLQRMTAGEKFKSRDEEIGHISMAIKDMAMDLRVPVVLLSQLNRSASNTRPNMAMLRESGNIEQDADVIVLLHAPDMEDVPGARRDDFKTISTERGKYLEMIIDKNRHGMTGIMPVAFYGSKMRYVPLKGR